MDNKRGTAQSMLCVDNKKDIFFGEFHGFRFKSAIPRSRKITGPNLAVEKRYSGVYCFHCFSSDVLVFPTVLCGVSPMVSQLSNFDGDIFNTFLAHVPPFFSLVQL